MHSTLRPSPAMAIVLVSLLVSLGALSGSAFGAVAAHELKGQASAINSRAEKSVTARCPPNKLLVGAGGNKSAAAAGQVALTAITPHINPGEVYVIGREDESGFAGNWGVSAWAICATPPPGLQRITVESAVNSSNKSVTATCPTGKKVLGAAGDITTASGQVSMVAIRPNSTLTAVTVTGAEDGTGFGGVWSVSAYAICATPPAGLQRVAATSASNSSNKTAQTNCPAGKGVLGTGGEITGGAGQVVMDLIPFPQDPVSVNARGFEDDTGFAGNWSVTSYAICAAVSKLVVETSAFDSSDGKTAQLTCPTANRYLTGVGGEISGGAGQVVLDDITPAFNPPNAAFATGFEDETGFAGDWSVTSYGICATPLPGLERVTDSSGFDSQPASGVSVFCPTGKKLVGGGGDIAGGFGQVVLDDIVYGSTLTDINATGYEDPTGYAGNWEVNVYGICATPPAGLQLVSVESASSTTNKEVTATCPTGKNLLGGGANLFSANGRVVLSSMRPNGSLRSATAAGEVGENGISEGWTVSAYAICANP